jgi:predicted dehydrogenase
MIKASIIGLGKMGLSHCAIMNAHPDINLVGVCDTSAIILEAFKRYSDINVYTDYQKMIEDEKPECIVVATPTKFHFEIVKYALERGIHVFCEKPFSLKNEEAFMMVQLAKDKGLVNQVGYHNRFLGTFCELKRLVEKNIIGDIYHFLGEAYGPVVVKEKAGTWRSKKDEGGGCLFDYASHVINLIQFVVGKPISVSGTQLKSVFSKDVEDTVYSSLSLNNGISGLLSVNWSDETFRKMSTSITLLGKSGKIVCDATELKIYLKEANTKEKLTKGWTIKYVTELTEPVNFYLRGEEYSSQLDYFFNAVKNKRTDNINSFETAYHTDQVIELLFKDSKTTR